jgi:hypothetical protein
LVGTWDVRITESSRCGSTEHNITLTIEEGNSAKYEADNEGSCHYKGSAWDELTFGHTLSGKSFVAKQKMRAAPSWLGHSSLQGRSGLRGRLNGPNSGRFTTSMTILDPRGEDEIEIQQEASMTRRSSVAL